MAFYRMASTRDSMRSAMANSNAETSADRDLAQYAKLSGFESLLLQLQFHFDTSLLGKDGNS
eukprot:5361102-Amphidinium_carterae.1